MAKLPQQKAFPTWFPRPLIQPPYPGWKHKEREAMCRIGISHHIKELINPCSFFFSSPSRSNRGREGGELGRRSGKEKGMTKT